MREVELTLALIWGLFFTLFGAALPLIIEKRLRLRGARPAGKPEVWDTGMRLPEQATQKPEDSEHGVGVPPPSSIALDQQLSLDSLATLLPTLGITHFERAAAEDELRFAVQFAALTIGFHAAIDKMGGLVVMSVRPPSDTLSTLSEEALSLAFTLRLLELNSENKVGTIGLQRLDDGNWRLWVDHYMHLGWRTPTQAMLSFTLEAICRVHEEVQDVRQSAQSEATIVGSD